MTAQIPEELILEGERTTMACCPELPEGHPRLVARDPGAATDPVLTSTACWPGYQATWEIRAGRFYLVAVRGRYALQGEGPLFADWYSGVLRVPRGEVLHYVHMGFETVYEQELYIKVEQGVVVASRLVDRREEGQGPGVQAPD
jgi:hypothetical protein